MLEQTINSESAVTVPYLLDIIFSKSPQPFKNTIQNAFSTFSHVLLRQRQLAQSKFVCDGSCSKESVLLDDICAKLNLKREDIDPDRLIWVPGETLAKFLIRPGQWVTIYRYREHSVRKLDLKSNRFHEDEFKCQVLPFSGATGDPKILTPIKLNPVTEYNLRKSLNIPPFMTIPPLQLKPLLTDPLIKTSNQSLSFSPIHGKSVKLTRLRSSVEVDPNECDVLIQDAFGLNCKYLCVGDLISLSITPGINVDLVVSEMNEKRTGDNCKELFKVTRESSKVCLNSFEAYNQFHSKVDEESLKRLLSPCLREPYQKIFGWVQQALVSNSNTAAKNCSTDLWPNILIYGPTGSGKFSVCQIIVAGFGLNMYVINGVNLIGDTSAYTEGKLKAIYEKVANSLCPALIYIKNLHLVGKDKDGNEDKRVVVAFKEFLNDIAILSTDSSSLPPHDMMNVMTSRAIFVMGSTETPDKLVPSISQLFLFKMEFPAVVKSIEDLTSTLKWFFDKGEVQLEDEVKLEEWTKINCGGMHRSYGDLKAIAATTVRNAFSKCVSAIPDEGTFNKSRIRITTDDLKIGLSCIDAVLKKSASTVEVPKVNWEDIGGLEDVKKELINSVKLPLEFPHLFGSGVRRSGILLYGPPGTGKTLIAKAVATEFKLSFLSVKGPELLNMYVGQSEQNVRDVFAKARNAAPCIIFFDELDALAPNRGRAGDSGGVMDRVVSQILAELDGTHSTRGIFVIGATNRPDLIDPALLRPGRFDKLLYVGISQDENSRTSVLKALTRKFNLDKDVDIRKVASSLPSGMSGADLYSLCSDAYMAAIERNISLISENAEEEDVRAEVLVKESDFNIALSRVVPSLSQDEQDKYERLNKDMNR